MFGGYHPYIRGWHNVLKAIYGELEHGATASQDVKELLGTLHAAHWPKAATNAACHDDKVLMWGHSERALEVDNPNEEGREAQ